MAWPVYSQLKKLVLKKFTTNNRHSYGHMTMWNYVIASSLVNNIRPKGGPCHPPPPPPPDPDPCCSGANLRKTRFQVESIFFITFHNQTLKPGGAFKARVIKLAPAPPPCGSLHSARTNSPLFSTAMVQQTRLYSLTYYWSKGLCTVNYSVEFTKQ